MSKPNPWRGTAQKAGKLYVVKGEGSVAEITAKVIEAVEA